MSTLLQIRTDLARELSDTNQRFLKTPDLNRIINQSQDQWTLDVEGLERIAGLAVKRAVNYLAAPSDFIRPRKMIWQEQYPPLEPIDSDKFSRRLGWMQYPGLPSSYCIMEGAFRLWPAPSADSLTGVLAAAGLAAADATMVLVSGLNFRTNGIAIVESEQIEWFSKDTTGNQLLNLRRGIAGTTATAHAAGTTVTQADIRLFYYPRPKTLVNDTDVSDIPDRYTHIFVFWAAYMALMDGEEKSLAQEKYEVYKAENERMVAQQRNKQRDKPDRVQSCDTGGQIYY